jgi:hypothetical protein
MRGSCSASAITTSRRRSTFPGGSAKRKSRLARVAEVAQEQQSQGLSGRLETVALYDLLMPDEIMRMFSRNDRLKRQLVLWAGHHPMMLQRVIYHDTKGPLAAVSVIGGRKINTARDRGM